MSTRRRGARQPRTEKNSDASPSSEMIGPGAEIPPTSDTNAGLLIVRHIFNYLVFTGVVAGLLYIYYTYFLFDVPTPVVLDVEDPNQPFAVVDIAGKGKGVIASRNISRGEFLLREEPLFVVPNRVHTSPGALLLFELSKISPRQRQKFYNLSYVHMPADLDTNTTEYNEALALAIFQTNSISAGANSGIFSRTARLNHGCSKAFNAVYTWREEEGALVVHALKDIKEGEELLTTYTDTKRPRDERRHYLKSLYDFGCECSVCTLPDELSRASDARLALMTQLKMKFGTWGSGEINGKEAIMIAREIWKVGEEEGYWSERGQLAADATWVAAAHSDAQASRGWAEAAEEWFGYELGRDSPQVEEMRRIAAQPLRHQVWGTRAAEGVGGPE